MTKICSKCKKELPLTIEFFRKIEKCKDGYAGQCAECIKNIRHQYRKDNKEKISQYKKQYLKNNKEHKKEYQKEHSKKYEPKVTKEYYKEYYYKNKEKYKASASKYYNKNKDNILKKHIEYYNKNKDKFMENSSKYYLENNIKIKQKLKEYKAKNRDYFNIANQNRRSLKKQLHSSLTLDQWEEAKKYFENCCAYCGKSGRLQQDHFIPLSNGGFYTKENIIPSCATCNSSKSSKKFSDWYGKYKHYSKNRESKIFEYLISFKQYFPS